MKIMTVMLMLSSGFLWYNRVGDVDDGDYGLKRGLMTQLTLNIDLL